MKMEAGPEAQHNFGIYKGRAERLVPFVDDDSIDMVFTDPVYNNIADYAWLLHESVRVLKDNRPVLAFTSTRNVGAVQAIADDVDGMSYVHTLYYVIVAKATKLRGYGIYTWTTPAILFTKGRPGDFRVYDDMPDTFTCNNSPADGRHRWNKNMAVCERWISSLTLVGDVVLDPFCGGGSIPAAAKRNRRRWVGVDKDQVAATEARIVVNSVQPLATVLEGGVYQYKMFEEL